MYLRGPGSQRNLNEPICSARDERIGYRWARAGYPKPTMINDFIIPESLKRKPDFVTSSYSVDTVILYAFFSL